MKIFSKVCLGLAAVVLTAGVALAERADDAGRKSKNGRVEATVDGVAVTVEFGRPNVKGRKIWGGLVPYGKVWRTGADEATTITFGGDVMIGGDKLAAGTYSLFTIPAADGWTFIFNKVGEQWGAFGYDSGEDALRVKAEPREADMEESMSFVVDGSSIVLRWEKLAVGFEVAAAG